MQKKRNSDFFWYASANHFLIFFLFWNFLMIRQGYFGHFLLEIPKYSFLFYLRNSVPLHSEWMYWDYYARYHMGINIDNPDVSKAYTDNIPKKYRYGIMKCPAVRKPVTDFGYISYGMLQYYIGGRASTLVDRGFPGLTFTRIKQPSSVAYLMDSVYSGKGANAFSSSDTSSHDEMGLYLVYNNGMNVSRRRHYGQTNTFLVDGHVEAFSEGYLRLVESGGYRDTFLLGWNGMM